MPSIGIDLDNTLINYDELLRKIITELGWFELRENISRVEIRAKIQSSVYGDKGWQYLQSLMYGQRIEEATLSDGAFDFIHKCNEREVSVKLISHKTEFSVADPGGIPLRDVATNWLKTRGILGEKMVSKKNIFYASSKAEKISIISRSDLSYFVDDLPEILHGRGFPLRTKKILYQPTYIHEMKTFEEVHVIRSFHELEKLVFEY